MKKTLYLLIFLLMGFINVNYVEAEDKNLKCNYSCPSGADCNGFTNFFMEFNYEGFNEDSSDSSRNQLYSFSSKLKNAEDTNQFNSQSVNLITSPSNSHWNFESLVESKNQEVEDIYSIYISDGNCPQLKIRDLYDGDKKATVYDFKSDVDDTNYWKAIELTTDFIPKDYNDILSINGSLKYLNDYSAGESDKNNIFDERACEYKNSSVDNEILIFRITDTGSINSSLKNSQKEVIFRNRTNRANDDVYSSITDYFGLDAERANSLSCPPSVFLNYDSSNLPSTIEYNMTKTESTPYKWSLSSSEEIEKVDRDFVEEANKDFDEYSEAVYYAVIRYHTDFPNACTVQLETYSDILGYNIIGKDFRELTNASLDGEKLFDGFKYGVTYINCVKDKEGAITEGKYPNIDNYERLSKKMYETYGDSQKLSIDLLTCDDILEPEMIKLIKNTFLILQITAVIAFILLTMLDFAKIIASSEVDMKKKGFGNFKVRLISVMALLVLLSIVSLVFDLAGITDQTCLSIFE